MKQHAAIVLVCCLLVTAASVSWGQPGSSSGISVVNEDLFLEKDGNKTILVWSAWVAFAKPTQEPITVSVKSDFSTAGPWAVKSTGAATEIVSKNIGSTTVYQRVVIATLESPAPGPPSALFAKDQTLELRISVRPSFSVSAESSVAQAQYNLKPLDYLLLAAAGRGSVREVTDLLESGASVNGTNLENKTALMMAASAGHLDVVKLLLERGANVNIRSKGCPFVVSQLASKRPGGWTALAAAASSGNSEVVRILLERGASVQAVADDQMSPLVAAINGRNPAIVHLLLQRGADVNAVNDSGYSMLAMADINGKAGIARVLRNHGGRIVVPWDVTTGGH
jgi:ankyrin repeat protein